MFFFKLKKYKNFFGLFRQRAYEWYQILDKTFNGPISTGVIRTVCTTFNLTISTYVTFNVTISTYDPLIHSGSTNIRTVCMTVRMFVDPE